MRQIRLPMLLAVLLLTLAACGGGEATETTTEAADTTTAAGQSIEGPPWRLAEARGIQMPQELSLTIQFQDGRVSGQSACNRFTGGYEIDGNSLTISELALTKKACPDQLTEVDSVLVRTLRRVAAYSFDGPRLQLLNPNERVALTYRPFSAADVQGRWLVIGLLNRNQEAFSTLIEGTKITANFKQNGQLQGNGGCNGYSGSYEVQGNTISIGDAAATQKECPQPKGLMGQENRYLQALNEAVTFVVAGRNLAFFDGDGIRLVTYRPAA
jgi:heat shock protein HslJ